MVLRFIIFMEKWICQKTINLWELFKFQFTIYAGICHFFLQFIMYVGICFLYRFFLLSRFMLESFFPLFFSSRFMQEYACYRSFDFLPDARIVFFIYIFSSVPDLSWSQVFTQICFLKFQNYTGICLLYISQCGREINISPMKGVGHLWLSVVFWFNLCFLVTVDMSNIKII